MFSPYFHMSAGMGMTILLALCVFAQMIILKSEFSPFRLMQLVPTVVYGCSVDLTTNMLSQFPDVAVWQRVIYCALGIAFLALGVFTMVKTGFLLPQDAVVGVISVKYQREYGKIKIAVDSILTAIAVIGSWILYGKLVSVGVGTIAAAVFVGKIISMLKEIEGLNRLLDRAICEKRKDNQYGSSKNNIFATPKNGYGTKCAINENRAFQRPVETTEIPIQQRRNGTSRPM